VRGRGKSQVTRAFMRAGLVIWITDKSATQPRWGIYLTATGTYTLPFHFLPIMSVDQPFNIYREELSSLYHGLALWDPKPIEELHKQPGHVSIGDVGYLDNGAFVRMFNVTLAWDHPSNNLLGKPGNYEPIKPSSFGDGHGVRENEFREGEYYTTHVSKDDSGVGVDRHEE
jgi:hypothetical protein